MRIIIGILVSLIIFSVGVCFKSPKMHTPIYVYNSDFVIETKPKEPEVSITKELPKVDKITQKTQLVSNSQKEETKVQTKPIDNKTKIKKDVIKQKTVVIEPKKEVKKEIQKEIKKEIKTPQNSQKVVKKKSVEEISQEQEEIIAWNKWHSEIQNSIMRDTKMPQVPHGTRFDFTFTVDKYGKISNIRAWSDNPYYNIYAVQYIAPVIKSYQGKSILNFPANSQRVSTQFIGKFKISQSAQNKYSKASDFNDSERIVK
jgi:hypothetical protein